jgi:hypothetical protein
MFLVTKLPFPEASKAKLCCPVPYLAKAISCPLLHADPDQHSWLSRKYARKGNKIQHVGEAMNKISNDDEHANERGGGYSIFPILF